MTTSLAPSFFRDAPFSLIGNEMKGAASNLKPTVHMSNDSELFNPMFYSVDNFCIMDDEFSGSDDELSDDDIIQCRPKSKTENAAIFQYDMDTCNLKANQLSTEPLDGDQLFHVSPLPSPYSTLSPTWEPRTPPKCRSWTNPGEHSHYMLTSIKESDEEYDRRLSSSEGAAGTMLSLATLERRDPGCQQAFHCVMKEKPARQPLHIRRKTSNLESSMFLPEQHGFNISKKTGLSEPNTDINTEKLNFTKLDLSDYVSKFSRGPAFVANRYRSLTF